MHLASENKEIVLQQQECLRHEKFKFFSSYFSAVSDTQAVPQTTPAPAPQTTPAPIVTSTGYNYPVPENPLPIRPVSTTAPPPPEPLPTLYGAPPPSRSGRQGRRRGGRRRGRGRRIGRRVLKRVL